MSKTSKMYIKGVLSYINTRDKSNVEDVKDVHLRGVEIHKYTRSKQCRRRRR